ncbi:MAG: peptide chain release factor 2 [Burkholderiales bacterium]
MLEIEHINNIEEQSKALRSRLDELRGYLDYNGKKAKLAVVNQELENPDIWNNPQQAQELSRQKKQLEAVVTQIDELDRSIANSSELFELGRLENDDPTILAVAEDLRTLESTLAKLEFHRMFSHPMDPNNCFIDVQAGSGGTEAQDWAEMLLRMYLRYCDKKGFHVEVLEEQAGDVAGIKNATLKVSGEYAFGYLRTETGVHRLVRNSPFDANNKRHTSFSSVFIYPEVDDNIEIAINPADLRIDTYRASGAGGQHINKTDSAVRITHLPTNTVVQCQNDRSQHRNRDEAFKMLKAKLYEIELRKKESERQKLEDNKTDIGWGHQIRSYVFDQSRIKDLRTGVEIGNIRAVMDGELDEFIAASLKQGV